MYEQSYVRFSFYIGFGNACTIARTCVSYAFLLFIFYLFHLRCIYEQLYMRLLYFY